MTTLVGLLTLIFASSTIALVPLEGLLYGDVTEISQNDPLMGVFSNDAVANPLLLSSQKTASFKEYLGLFQQGKNLKNSCSFISSFRYSTPWKEKQAKRTIASTLQYIGIDQTMKAIVEYVKLLDFTEDEFTKLSTNLISITCSKNLSLYSIKLLKDNFKNLYDNHTKGQFQLPGLIDSPYYSEDVKLITNSVRAKKKELELTVRAFRSFCSWNGDTDNYRLMTPYLQNPFVMSVIYNNLLDRKISYNEETTVVEYKENKKTVKVTCEHLICRKTNTATFKQNFPRMVGATDLGTDFSALYCGHFSKLDYDVKGQGSTIKKWIKETTIDSPHLEAMNFLSLLTKQSDILVGLDNYAEVNKVIKSSIDSRWNKWAKEKTSNLVTDLLFEESLNVDLKTLVNTSSNLKGELSIIFDFTLGEMDRVLEDDDKVTSVFHLNLPENYLRWMRKEYIAKNNLSDYRGLKDLEQKVEAYIKSELDKKKKYFLIPLWNERLAGIIAREIQSQIVEYKGSKYKNYTNKAVSIPVRFRYGLFALKYLNEKFKAKYRSVSSVSAKP